MLYYVVAYSVYKQYETSGSVFGHGYRRLGMDLGTDEATRSSCMLHCNAIAEVALSKIAYNELRVSFKLTSRPNSAATTPTWHSRTTYATLLVRVSTALVSLRTLST